MLEESIIDLKITDCHLPLGQYVKLISEYKGRLDKALVTKMQRISSNEDEEWLEAEGFDNASPTGTGVHPDTFARWVFGPFTKSTGWDKFFTAAFPAYYAIGWNRRQYAKVSKSEADDTKAWMDARTIDPAERDGFARWLSPLPVVIASEGKHRVDLFREHQLTMLANLHVTAMPPAADLELRKIWGSDDVWALRCLNPEFRRDRQSEFAPLPIPALSVPLFKAYGVKVRNLPCFPWQVRSSEISTLPFLQRLNPKHWRTRILRAGYV